VPGRYVFDPNTIHEIAARNLGSRPAEMFAAIEGQLTVRYPGHIDRTQPWIFSNAGGAMIQVRFLYASFSEYVLFFGTPVGTEGHSGRHPAEFHDTVLDGEAWYYREGQFDRDVHRPGDRIFVGRGQAAGMRIPDHVWMVEYCRGAIPLMLPFGLADALTSTLDLKTIVRTQAIYARLLRLSVGRALISRAGRN
jgi:hypothetical protein